MLMLMAENLLKVMSALVLLVGSHAVYKHRQLFLADIAGCCYMVLQKQSSKSLYFCLWQARRMHWFTLNSTKIALIFLVFKRPCTLYNWKHSVTLKLNLNLKKIAHFIKWSIHIAKNLLELYLLLEGLLLHLVQCSIF